MSKDVKKLYDFPVSSMSEEPIFIFKYPNLKNNKLNLDKNQIEYINYYLEMCKILFESLYPYIEKDKINYLRPQRFIYVRSKIKLSEYGKPQFYFSIRH